MADGPIGWVHEGCARVTCGYSTNQGRSRDLVTEATMDDCEDSLKTASDFLVPLADDWPDG
jgi:hypothetical protein